MSEQSTPKPPAADWYLEAAKEIVQDLLGGTPVDQSIVDSEHHRTVAILKRYCVTKANVRAMLTMACGDPTPCCHCQRPVWWLTMLKSGRKNPITEDGISHFADCSGAASFRKGNGT